MSKALTPATVCPRCGKSGGKGWVRREQDGKMGPLEHAVCELAFPGVIATYDWAPMVCTICGREWNEEASAAMRRYYPDALVCEHSGPCVGHPRRRTLPVSLRRRPAHTFREREAVLFMRSADTMKQRQLLLGLAAPPSHQRIDRKTGLPFPTPAWQAARERKAHEGRMLREKRELRGTEVPNDDRTPADAEQRSSGWTAMTGAAHPNNAVTLPSLRFDRPRSTPSPQRETPSG